MSAACWDLCWVDWGARVAQDPLATGTFRRRVAPPADGPTQAEATPPHGEAMAGNDAARQRRTVRNRRIATEDLGRIGQQGGLDPLMARLSLACWNHFFDCFRADELAMEFPRYQQEAEEVRQALASLGERDLPDLPTCQKMLFLLSRFNRERFRELSSRIEELAHQSRDLQSRLEAASMDGAYSADQLTRFQDVLRLGYAALDLPPPDQAGQERNPTALLTGVVQALERDRSMLATIADALPPAAFASLPVEAQVYLRFFRRG